MNLETRSTDEQIFLETVRAMVGDEDSVTRREGETGKPLSHRQLRESTISFHTQQERERHRLLSEKRRRYCAEWLQSQCKSADT